MPIEGWKPGSCCRSNTDYSRACPRYWVLHVPSGCDPVFAYLEPGVALVYTGVQAPAPAMHHWVYIHIDVIPAIFRICFLRKGRTDTGGFWWGRAGSALLSALEKDKLIDINNPIPDDIGFLFPLVPVWGPEDPDFLPQGMTFSYFMTRSAILADFPDCDLRMLPT